MISLTVLIALLLIMPFCVRRWWRVRLARAQAGCAQAKAALDSLLADHAALEDENARLKHALEEIVQLYDITREITRFLEEEAVFAAFSEKIKRFFDFDDVRLLPAGANLAEYPGYDFYPLTAGAADAGTLAASGIRERDKEKFHITAQQFLLGHTRAVLYQKVQELATRDGLTGTLSRRYWFARCSDELARSRRYGFYATCLMIDVDHFKDLNDTFGHLVGDAILAAVAGVIKDGIRSIDLIGKYGGEEFVLLLTETDTEQAFVVAERIRQKIQTTGIRAYDETLAATISIGIAGFPDDAQDLDRLVENADKALYRAKLSGRNRTCLYAQNG